MATFLFKHFHIFLYEINRLRKHVVSLITNKLLRYKTLTYKQYSLFYTKTCIGFFKTERILNEFGYQLIITATTITFVALSLLTGSIESGTLATLLVFLVISSVYFLLRFIVHKGFKHTGSNIRWTFPSKALVKASNGIPVTVNTAEIDIDRFKFADEDDAWSSAIINVFAYSNSLWCGPYLEKYERNLSHIKKNKFSILLIKSTIKPDSYIGFTHVFPVSKKTWDDYQAGGIGDNHFSHRLICPTQISENDEDVYGFILFSLADVSTSRDYDGKEDYRIELGSLFDQAVAYHIQSHCEHYYGQKKKYVNVMMQNWDDRYIDFFKLSNREFTKQTFDGNLVIDFQVGYNF